MKQLLILFAVAITFTTGMCWWFVRLTNAPETCGGSAGAPDRDWVD